MPTLTLDQIVSAARDMIARDGFEGLSMRRLAAELDSKPMSLYHHIGNKSALLGMVMTQVAEEYDWVEPTGTPRERMIAVGIDTLHRLLEMPWIVPVLARGTHFGRGALHSNDHFLAAAIEAGASDTQAVHLWRALWGHVVGEVTVITAMSSHQDPPWTDTFTAVPEAPTIDRLLPSLPEIVTTYDPEQGIADLIDGAVTRWARS